MIMIDVTTYSSRLKEWTECKARGWEGDVPPLEGLSLRQETARLLAQVSLPVCLSRMASLAYGQLPHFGSKVRHSVAACACKNYAGFPKSFLRKRKYCEHIDISTSGQHFLRFCFHSHTT